MFGFICMLIMIGIALFAVGSGIYYVFFDDSDTYHWR